MKEVRAQAMWIYLDAFQKESLAGTKAVKHKRAFLVLEVARPVCLG